MDHSIYWILGFAHPLRRTGVALTLYDCVIDKLAIKQVADERSDRSTGRRTYAIHYKHGETDPTAARDLAPYRQAKAHIKVVDKPKATDRNATEHSPEYMTGNRP